MFLWCEKCLKLQTNYDWKFHKILFFLKQTCKVCNEGSVRTREFCLIPRYFNNNNKKKNKNKINKLLLINLKNFQNEFYIHQLDCQWLLFETRLELKYPSTMVDLFPSLINQSLVFSTMTHLICDLDEKKTKIMFLFIYFSFILLDCGVVVDNVFDEAPGNNDCVINVRD